MKHIAREIHGILLTVAVVAWLIVLPTTGLLYLLGALR